MRRVVFIVILFCAFIASPVMADLYGTIMVDYEDVDPFQNVAIWSTNPGLTGGASIDAGVWNLNVWNATNTFNGYLADGQIESFCIDVWDVFLPSGVMYDMISLDVSPDPLAGPMGDLRAGYLAQLLDTYWSGSLTNQQAVALQVAIWEIVDEGSQSSGDPSPSIWDTSYGEGDFYLYNDSANSAISSMANDMLDAIVAAGPAMHMGRYIGLSSPQNPPGEDKTNYQDFLVRVPVPGAVLLGILGLGVVGIKLRKYA